MKFQEKIKDFFEKVDEKNLYYIFVGAIVVLFLLDYFILMRPQINSINKVSPEIIKVKEKIDAAKRNMQQVSNFRQQVKESQEKFNEISLKIKSKTEVPLILETISRIANENDVKIDQIMPNTQDQELLLEDGKLKYYSLPIIVDARTSYHSLGRFINQIEKEDVLLNIYNFMISSREDSRYHGVRLYLRAIVYE